MQRAIEQRLVEFAIDAHISLQPQCVALDGGHGTDPGFEAADFMTDGRNLAIDHLNLGVARGEARKEFSPQLLGLKQLCLQLHRQRKCRFGLFVESDGAILIAEASVGVFRVFQLLLKFGQLSVKEFDRLLCLGRLALDILAHVLSANFVERAAQTITIAVFKRNADHIRLLTLFAKLHTFLQVFNCCQQ
ncbi:hypothetical protein D3C71_1555930 [compost metagenome]